jgi:hypothetical protein
MKIWRWVFAALGWFGLVGLGFMVLLTAMEPKAVPRAVVFEIERIFGSLMLEGQPAPVATVIGCYVGGAALLLVAALALATPLGKSRRLRLLEFPTESGKVQVDISALEQCLGHVVSEEEGVIRARVNLRGGTGGSTPLGCNATIWFEAGPDVIGRVSEIQARMRAYYYQVLPIKEPVKINITTKLVYQKSTARTVDGQIEAPADRVTPRESQRTEAVGEEAAEKKLPAPADDYTGPQYPTTGHADEEDGKI